jgi:ATP-dependent Clp protease ATP-binding subunit ClpA
LNESKAEGNHMIAQELEVSLHMAFVEARQQRHEFITVEHLLLALLDNPSAAEVLRACSANIDDLRKSLANFIKDNTPQVAGTDDVDTQPTLGFQRVIQRAIMHVQSTGNGKKEVTGANVLVAIFGEKDSHAVYYLHQQGVTRLDVVNFIAHGIKKSDPPEPAKSGEASSSEGEEGGEKNEKASPLEQFTQNLNQAAKDGKIDPLIGREYEVERVIQILCRRARTTRCWWARPAWARPRSPKAWPGASPRRTCRRSWPSRASTRWTWARCWPAPSTAAISSSA